MNAMTADERAVRKVAERMVTLWNTHAMAGMGEIYADDADFVNVIGLRWKGAAQITQMHVLLHASRMKQTTLTVDDRSVRFLATDVAVVHDTWSMTGDPGAPGWKIGDVRRGILMHVLQRTEEAGWKMAVSQNTDIHELPNL